MKIKTHFYFGSFSWGRSLQSRLDKNKENVELFSTLFPTVGLEGNYTKEVFSTVIDAADKDGVNSKVSNYDIKRWIFNTGIVDDSTEVSDLVETSDDIQVFIQPIEEYINNRHNEFNKLVARYNKANS